VADIPCVKKGLDSISSWKSPWLTDVFVAGGDGGGIFRTSSMSAMRKSMIEAP
jgi:hypothetical protein